VGAGCVVAGLEGRSVQIARSSCRRQAILARPCPHGHTTNLQRNRLPLRERDSSVSPSDSRGCGRVPGPLSRLYRSWPAGLRRRHQRAGAPRAWSPSFCSRLRFGGGAACLTSLPVPPAGLAMPAPDAGCNVRATLAGLGEQGRREGCISLPERVLSGMEGGGPARCHPACRPPEAGGSRDIAHRCGVFPTARPAGRGPGKMRSPCWTRPSFATIRATDRQPGEDAT